MALSSRKKCFLKMMEFTLPGMTLKYSKKIKMLLTLGIVKMLKKNM